MTSGTHNGAPPATRGAALLCLLILLGAGAGDVALAIRVHDGALDAGSALLLHVAMLAAAGQAVVRLAPPDLSPFVLALSLAVVSGPIGLLAGLSITLAARRARSGRSLVRQWRAWADQDSGFDAGVLLAERIECGRALRPSRPRTGAFSRTMGGEDFTSKQWLLGLVAQRFHPDLAPVLGAALKDPEPGLRVQAAAVRTRLNDRVKVELRELLALGASPAESADAACQATQRMMDCLKSALLDVSETRRLRAAAIGLCRDALARHGPSAALQARLRQLLWEDGDHAASLALAQGEAASLPA